VGSATSPFLIDDAIVGLAQPLTEALNQLASGLRRASNLIEELGRREEFYLNLAGGSSGRTARAVFHNAHLSYKLPRANRAEKDGVAIEVPDYVDGTAQEAKNTVRRISLSEEDLPFGEVRASHLRSSQSATGGGALGQNGYSGEVSFYHSLPIIEVQMPAASAARMNGVTVYSVVSYRM
jgi:hypothetical protein